MGHPHCRGGCWTNIHIGGVDIGQTSTLEGRILVNLCLNGRMSIGPISTPPMGMLAPHPDLQCGCWPNIHPSNMDIIPALLQCGCWPNIHPYNVDVVRPMIFRPNADIVLTSSPPIWILAQQPPLRRGYLPNIHPASVDVCSTYTPPVWCWPTIYSANMLIGLISISPMWIFTPPIWILA